MNQIASRRDFMMMSAATLAASVSKSSAASTSETTAEQEGLYSPAGDEKVIVLGGDYFLDHRLSTENPAPQVFDAFRKADFSFANLECGLSTVGSAAEGGFTYGPALRGDPSLVTDLHWAGIRNVSVANNHVGNYGRKALIQTLDTLDKAGITYSGAGKNIEAAYAPAYTTVNGFKVGFCSFYSFISELQANDVATEKEAGIAVSRAYEVVLQPTAAFDTAKISTPPYLIQTVTPPHYRTLVPGYSDLALMKEAVRKAAAEADFVFVSVHFHWALHGLPYLPPLQRVVAQELVDSGADLFLGHGPHAVRAVEVYKGKPIFYSVGNLVLRDERDQSKITAVERQLPADEMHQAIIVRAAITKHAVRSAEVLPISMDSMGAPVFALHDQASATVNRLVGLSAALNTRVQMKGWFGDVKL